MITATRAKSHHISHITANMFTDAADMLLTLTLVFVGKVCCEWVEISQHHYVKPLRPTYNYPFTTVSKPVLERTTKANRIYINNSLPDHSWNKDNVYNVPNVKLVQLDSGGAKNKPGRINFNDESDKEDVTTRYGYRNNGIVGLPQSGLIKKDSIEKHEERPKDPNHRFSNNNNVKGVSHLEKPFKMEHQIEYNNRPIEVLNLSDLEYATGEDIFTNIELVEPNPNIGKIPDRTYHVTAKIPPMMNKSDSNRLNDAFLDERPEIITHKTSNIDNIKKVQLKSSTEKPTTTKENIYKYSTTVKPHNRYFKNKAGSRIPSDSDEFEISMHGISSIEKVKRVQPAKNRATLASDKHTLNENAFKISDLDKVGPTMDDKRNIPKINTGNIKRVHVSSTQRTFTERPKIGKNPLIHFEPIKRPTVRNPEDVMLEEILNEDERHSEEITEINISKDTMEKISLGSDQKPPEYLKPNESGNNVRGKKPASNPEFMTEKEMFDNKSPSNKYKNINPNVVNIKKGELNSITKTPTVASFETEPEKSVVVELESPVPPIKQNQRKNYKPIKNNIEKRPEFVTSEEIKVEDDETVKDYLPSINSETVKGINSEPPLKETPDASINKFSSIENNKPTSQRPNDQYDSSTVEEEKGKNNTNANTMENVVRFLKVVTDTISKNTRRSFKGKMRYLENLKDTILTNIEERIEAAFPDDTGPRMRVGRSAREHAAPRGHVEIPSSESALMTISFLTFAVFLIKLVLQVIQAYKQKTMMVPAVVATVGRTVNQYRSRNMKYKN